MFRIIEKMFIVLLTSLMNAYCIVNVSNPTKCVFLSNEKCDMQPTLINLQCSTIQSLCCFFTKDTVKNCTTTHLRLN